MNVKKITPTFVFSLSQSSSTKTITPTFVFNNDVQPHNFNPDTSLYSKDHNKKTITPTFVFSIKPITSSFVFISKQPETSTNTILVTPALNTTECIENRNAKTITPSFVFPSDNFRFNITPKFDMTVTHIGPNQYSSPVQPTTFNQPSFSFTPTCQPFPNQNIHQPCLNVPKTQERLGIEQQSAIDQGLYIPDFCKSKQEQKSINELSTTSLKPIGELSLDRSRTDTQQGWVLKNIIQTPFIPQTVSPNPQSMNLKIDSEKCVNQISNPFVPSFKLYCDQQKRFTPQRQAFSCDKNHISTPLNKPNLQDGLKSQDGLQRQRSCLVSEAHGAPTSLNSNISPPKLIKLNPKSHVIEYSIATDQNLTLTSSNCKTNKNRITFGKDQLIHNLKIEHDLGSICFLDPINLGPLEGEVSPFPICDIFHFSKNEISVDDKLLARYKGEIEIIYTQFIVDEAKAKKICNSKKFNFINHAPFTIRVQV